MNPPDRVITKRVLLVLCKGIGVAGKKRTPSTSIEIVADTWITSNEAKTHLQGLMAQYDALVVMGSTWEKAQPTRDYLLALGYPVRIASTCGEAVATYCHVERVAFDEVGNSRSTSIAPVDHLVWTSPPAAVA